MRSGWNDSRPSSFSRHAGELDRRAGDVAHRQRRAAARIAVELGEHDAGERQRVAERVRGVDRVLALHRIDDEQRLDRLHRRVQLARSRCIIASSIASRPAVSTISTS